MFDTVWLVLTAMPGENPNDIAEQQYTMFGPNGVTQFQPYKGGTILSTTIVVKETPEYIFNMIAMVRRTKGLFNGEEEQGSKSGSESETSHSEAPSEVHAGDPAVL